MHKPPEFFDEDPHPARVAAGNRLAARGDRQLLRAQGVPENSVLKIERFYKDLQERRKNPWDEQRTLRFLSLARNPKLSISQIVTLLREEFNEPRFTKSSLCGKLDRLRKYARRFYEKDSKPECHSSTAIEK